MKVEEKNAGQFHINKLPEYIFMKKVDKIGDSDVQIPVIAISARYDEKRFYKKTIEFRLTFVDHKHEFRHILCTAGFGLPRKLKFREVIWSYCGIRKITTSTIYEFEVFSRKRFNVLVSIYI